MVVTPALPGVFGFSFPGIPGVTCLFTARDAGNVSLLRANLGNEDLAATHEARKRLFDVMGVETWTELKQVHGDRFLCNPDPTNRDAESSLEADGHATDETRHALMIKTADCQPVLLAHPDGFVGALHVGWRGNVLRFIVSGVKAFCDSYGLSPADVRAVRGPSLGLAEFVNFEKEWPPAFAPWYDATTRRMDLWSLTRAQLREAGLLENHIFGLDFCTYTQNDCFFSHRRGDTGRQAAFIWKR
ncbi:MAG: Polyphenol oxidase [Desulfovibrio sp.]